MYCLKLLLLLQDISLFSFTLNPPSPMSLLAHAGAHSLSVRRGSTSAFHAVKHYRIHQLENGWHYISPRLTFPTLNALVEYYSGGLTLTHTQGSVDKVSLLGLVEHFLCF